MFNWRDAGTVQIASVKSISAQSPCRISPVPVPPMQMAPLRSADRHPAVQTLPTMSSMEADRRASRFASWMIEHGLSAREWAVDDVWWLAEEDFSPTHGLALPPRRVFLGSRRCLFR